MSSLSRPMVLYCENGDASVLNVLIIAEYKGMEIELKDALQGKKPRLVAWDGKTVMEDRPYVIAQFLAKKCYLFAGSPEERCKNDINYWISRSIEIDDMLGESAFKLAGKISYQIPDDSTQWNEVLTKLENHLTATGKAFLVGNSVTLADIFMVSALFAVFGRQCKCCGGCEFEKLQSQYAQTYAYYLALMEKPDFLAAAAKFENPHVKQPRRNQPFLRWNEADDEDNEDHEFGALLI